MLFAIISVSFLSIVPSEEPYYAHHNCSKQRLTSSLTPRPREKGSFHARGASSRRLLNNFDTLGIFGVRQIFYHMLTDWPILTTISPLPRCGTANARCMQVWDELSKNAREEQAASARRETPLRNVLSEINGGEQLKVFYRNRPPNEGGFSAYLSHVSAKRANSWTFLSKAAWKIGECTTDRPNSSRTIWTTLVYTAREASQSIVGTVKK